MDFLNNAVAQLRELFHSMTPAARITTGALLAVVVVSLAYLFRYPVNGGGEYLLGGEPIPASHLPAMEAAFAKANLTDYEVHGTRIKILRGHPAEYMGALADEGALPPQFGSYFEKSLAGDSPFLSSKDKQERLKVAKQKEIAGIISRMQGIESAAVLYDIRTGRGSLHAQDIITASVNVKPQGDQPLEPGRIPMIRNLVVAAIAGLKREDVTVTDLNGRTYVGSENGLGDAIEDPYYKRMAMYEKQVRQKALEVLSMIPGVDVQVSAELDPEIKHLEESEVFDPKAVVGESETVNEVETSKNSLPGGRPGLQAQAAQGPAGGAASVASQGPAVRTSSTDKEVTRERTKSFVSRDLMQVEKKGLTPKRVKVAVVVPSRYYLQVWQSRQTEPPTEGQPDAAQLGQIENEVKKSIEDLVVPLLPSLEKGADPFPQVTVTTLPSLPRAEILPPSFGENALAWLGQSWATLGLIALAGASLMVLRSMLKAVATPVEKSPASSPPGEAPSTLSLVSEDDDDSDKSEEDSSGRLKRRIKKGPNLKDELTELVREDPDAAASILRNWIANAS